MITAACERFRPVVMLTLAGLLGDLYLKLVHDWRKPAGLASVQSSLVERFEGVDEVRPGTFVFYDLTQLAIGSCTEEQIALAVACPVVAKHLERGEVVLYGGAVHLSKDFLEADGVRQYGAPAERLATGGWGRILESSYLRGLSQEHGILKAAPRAFEAARIGDWIPVIPAHCCLAVHQLREFLTLEGERL